MNPLRMKIGKKSRQAAGTPGPLSSPRKARLVKTTGLLFALLRRYRIFILRSTLLAYILVGLAGSGPGISAPLGSQKPNYYSPPQASIKPVAFNRNSGFTNKGRLAWGQPRAPYDKDQPCFTNAQMKKARRVLFAGIPVRDRQVKPWLDNLNDAFHELGLKCRDNDFLVLVLTTIQLESGVRVDPPLENRNLEVMFNFKLDRVRNDNFLAGKVLDEVEMISVLKRKLRRDTRRKIVLTEGDLGRYVETNLRVWLAGYLKQEYYLPRPIAQFSAEKLLRNPVNTIGPMQVNVSKAFRNANLRGEGLDSRQDMLNQLLAKESALGQGLKEGIYQLWLGYRFYRKRLRREDAVRFATADYNAGEFSSRNAAFQQRVARLSKYPITLDGDLLVYEGGKPRKKVSNTEAAILTMNTRLSPERIRKDLLLEKKAAFNNTRTAKRVCARYRKATGKPCRQAQIPSGANNAAGKLKTGRKYTPDNYARAYLRRWMANRAIYDQ